MNYVAYKTISPYKLETGTQVNKSRTFFFFTAQGPEGDSFMLLKHKRAVKIRRFRCQISPSFQRQMTTKFINAQEHTYISHAVYY